MFNTAIYPHAIRTGVLLFAPRLAYVFAQQVIFFTCTFFVVLCVGSNEWWGGRFRRLGGRRCPLLRMMVLDTIGVFAGPTTKRNDGNGAISTTITSGFMQFPACCAFV